MSTQRYFSISLATGQAFLQEKCQRWVQARLQGLRRAMFWGWQQAAARRRPVVASPEQLLLQRGGPGGGSARVIPTPEAAGRAPRDGRLGGLCSSRDRPGWRPGIQATGA